MATNPAPIPSRKYTLSASTPAVADQVNHELDTVYNVLQGAVGDVHIADNANIAGSKIADATVTVSKTNNPYKARVYLSAGTQSIPNAVLTKVAFDAKSYDTNTNFDVATNHRYTVPVTGYYMITMNALFTSTPANCRIIASIQKNGSGIAVGNWGAPANSDFSTAVNDIVSLTAGDYIEGFVYHDGGPPVNINNSSIYTYLAIHLLSI